MWLVAGCKKTRNANGHLGKFLRIKLEICKPVPKTRVGRSRPRHELERHRFRQFSSSSTRILCRRRSNPHGFDRIPLSQISSAKTETLKSKNPQYLQNARRYLNEAKLDRFQKQTDPPLETPRNPEKNPSGGVHPKPPHLAANSHHAQFRGLINTDSTDDRESSPGYVTSHQFHNPDRKTLNFAANPVVVKLPMRPSQIDATVSTVAETASKVDRVD